MAWMKAKKAAEYAGVSLDVFEEFIKDGLRYAQPRKLRLFRASDIDAFMERYMIDRSGQATKIAGDILASMNMTQ